MPLRCNKASIGTTRGVLGSPWGTNSLKVRRVLVIQGCEHTVKLTIPNDPTTSGPSRKSTGDLPLDNANVEQLPVVFRVQTLIKGRQYFPLFQAINTSVRISS